MLPELLFSVGSSMQDISREDFTLLNGGCDKDVATPLDQIKLGRTPDLEPVVSIKLEDTSTDIFSWHSSTNIGSNLLRHSDDPLISGAIDDNQNEFNPITTCDATITSRSSPSLIIPTTTVSTSTLNIKKKTTRTRRKGQFKLRFHHQALPPEYLDHYETAQKNLLKSKDSKLAKAFDALPTNKVVDQMDPQDRANETVRNWLRKINEFQSETTPSTPLVKDEIDMDVISQINQLSMAKKSPKTISYNDLPYMGEMTLANSKPRRGRKPKKADICHLIYKNYGTILPGTPKDMVDSRNKIFLEPTNLNLSKASPPITKINSLLEKRLTQESKKVTGTVPISIDDGTECEKNQPAIKKEAEPLNLCVRDRTETFTLSSDDDSDSVVESSRTTPLITPDDVATDAVLAANLKMALPNFQSALLESKTPSTPNTPSTASSDNATSTNLPYWNGTGLFVHPMSVYYQKIADSSSTGTVGPLTSSTPSTPNGSPKPCVSPSISTKTENQSQSKVLIPKNISQLLKQDKPQSSLLASRDTSGSSTKSNTPIPQKRKRSAIFIPPMPAESSNNHATEVSICKFKFTGGAKPSLQEKKMLSVDSGGNFRYYSGTGDKSMRGYEFFPRESLQQSSLMAASSSGAFLNTPGEKISFDLPPPSHDLSNELLQIPDLPTPHNVCPPSSVQQQPNRVGQSSDRRKRKSRRSLQREKLEKTFKEKGFLIQTQQLESAEGATYCKFRQLRKFTRYLFRSWKDYLPGELQQGAGATSLTGGTTDTTINQNDIETITAIRSTSSFVHSVEPTSTIEN